MNFWKLEDRDGVIYVNPSRVAWIQRCEDEDLTEIMYGDGKENRVLVFQTPEEILNFEAQP